MAIDTTSPREFKGALYFPYAYQSPWVYTCEIDYAKPNQLGDREVFSESGWETLCIHEISDEKRLSLLLLKITSIPPEEIPQVTQAILNQWPARTIENVPRCHEDDLTSPLQMSIDRLSNMLALQSEIALLQVRHERARSVGLQSGVTDSAFVSLMEHYGLSPRDPISFGDLAPKATL